MTVTPYKKPQSLNFSTASILNMLSYRDLIASYPFIGTGNGWSLLVQMLNISIRAKVQIISIAFVCRAGNRLNRSSLQRELIQSSNSSLFPTTPNLLNYDGTGEEFQRLLFLFYSFRKIILFQFFNSSNYVTFKNRPG